MHMALSSNYPCDILNHDGSDTARIWAMLLEYRAMNAWLVWEQNTPSLAAVHTQLQGYDKAEERLETQHIHRDTITTIETRHAEEVASYLFLIISN